MANKDLTEIVFIIDRSGSMMGLEADTIGGYNTFLEQQKKEEGKAFVSTILFSTHSEVIHDRVPLDEVKPMTEQDYVTMGVTALIDAMGGAIKHIRNIHKYARSEDVPGHTIFVIITDGMENASREYSSDQVKKLVKEQTEAGWEFLFLGANIDAVETAKNYGIMADRAVDYCCDAAGTQLNYRVVGKAVSAMRKSVKRMDASWKEEVEKDYKARRKTR